jgi:hypothetical protein
LPEFAFAQFEGIDCPNVRHWDAPSWLKMLVAPLWHDGPGRQSPVSDTWPLVLAMYAGRLWGKWTAVKFVATPRAG